MILSHIALSGPNTSNSHLWRSIGSFMYTDKTSLKADREVGGRGASARRTAPGDHRDVWGRGPRAEIHHKLMQNPTRAHQDALRTLQNSSSRHHRCPGISQSHFSNHLVNIQLHEPQGHAEPERDPRTIEAPEPQPQDHARRNH